MIFCKAAYDCAQNHTHCLYGVHRPPEVETSGPLSLSWACVRYWVFGFHSVFAGICDGPSEPWTKGLLTFLLSLLPPRPLGSVCCLACLFSLAPGGHKVCMSLNLSTAASTLSFGRLENYSSPMRYRIESGKQEWVELEADGKRGWG